MHGSRARQLRRQPARDRRKRLGLSQEALAELCDLHRTEISLLERSKRSPRLNTMVDLARGLRLSSVCDLLDSTH